MNLHEMAIVALFNKAHFYANDPHKELTWNTLLNPKATHNMKVAAVNALYHRKMSVEDIVQLVAKIGVWYPDYSTASSRIKLKVNENVYIQSERDVKGIGSVRFTEQRFFKDATSYLQYFVEHYAIPAEPIQLTMRGMVVQHIDKGRIPLPKAKGEKRIWFSNRSGAAKFQWKHGKCDYSKTILTYADVSLWDYSNGICLVVPKDWRDDCYLDIDVRSEEHPNGVDPSEFPEMVKMLDGFYYEWTINKGIHVFGRGYPKKPPEGIGLELVSTYIVTYPTSGYTMGQEVKK